MVEEVRGMVDEVDLKQLIAYLVKYAQMPNS